MNKLYEFSNRYIEVRIEKSLPMPGFSTIEKDIYGRFKPLILINPKVLTEDNNILAHVLAHEWGHHKNNHIPLIAPNENEKETKAQIDEKEDEADLFAAEFIKEYQFDKGTIISFMRSSRDQNLNKRIMILNALD